MLKTCVVLVAFVAAVSAMNITKRDTPMHIVYLLVDDLGWNDVGWHGGVVQTPNIDKLASGGVIIDNNYVAPVCTPSRGQLMTGNYAYHMGMQHRVIHPASPECLSKDVVTMPEALKQLGYATHMVGKWHLGYCNIDCTPTYRGFDTFFGFYNGYVDHYTHMVAGGYDWRDGEEVVRNEGEYSTTLQRDRAVKLIKEHDQSKPFYLYLPFAAVHSPIQAPQEFIDLYDASIPEPRRTYLGMVSAVDEAIGQIYDALEETGMLDNTLIAFSSDNGGEPGGSSNYPLRGSKGSIWEGGVRVPGFAYSQKMSKSGYKHDGLFHEADWYPTILSLAGSNAPDGLDGVDQSAMLLDGADSARDELVMNLDQYTPCLFGRGAIRVGDYKLVVGYPGIFDGYGDENGQGIFQTHTDTCEIEMVQWGEDLKITKRRKFALDIPAIMQVIIQMDGTSQLFNIKEDPSERNNLAASEPEMLQTLLDRFQFYWDSKAPVDLSLSHEIPEGSASNFGGVWSPGWC